MSLFDTSDVSTQGQSSVPVTGGVQDNSGAMLADTLGKVGGIIGTAYNNKKQAEAASNLKAGRSAFADKQLSLAQAVDRGDISSAEAKRRMRVNARTALAEGLDFADVKEIQAGISSTSGLGKITADGTESEQAFAKLKSEAEGSGFVMIGASPEKTAEGVEMYQRDQRARKTMSLESQELGLISQRDSVSTQLRTSEQKTAIKELAVTQQYKLQEVSNQIIADLRAGNIDEGQALLMIEDQFRPVISTIEQVGPETGALLDVVSKPILDIKQYYTDMATGKIDTEVGSRAISNALQEQTVMMLGDERIAQQAALSKLFGHSGVAQLGIETEVARWLTNNTKAMGGDKVSDPTVDTPEERKTVQDALQWLRKDLNQSSSSINPENHKRNMDQQVESLLQGVFDHGGRVKNPKEFNQVVEFLSSPEFGQYASNNQIPDEVRSEAMDMLERQYTDRVLPILKENYDTANISGATSLGLNPETASVVEPVFSGSGVRFKAKRGIELSRAAQGSIETLNRTVTPFLNRLIRMGAHMEGGRNYKQVYEQNFQGIFGEKLNDPAE